MVLTQFDKAGGTIKKWNFINAWPGSVSEIPLAWDAAAIEEFTCSWNYDYWTESTPGGVPPAVDTVSVIPPPTP